MSDSIIVCGNCDKEVGKEFCFARAFIKPSIFKSEFQELAICEKCFRKIPESLRAPRCAIVNDPDPDLAVFGRAEKNGNGGIFLKKPFYGIRRCVVNYCANGFCRKLWPRLT
jgi:hypothetical protein